MSARSGGDDEITRLVSLLLDGQLTMQERVLLEMRIEADADARRSYVEIIDQEIELECVTVLDASAAVVKMVEAIERRDVEMAVRRRWRWLAAAAALIASLTVLWILAGERVPEQPSNVAQSRAPGAGANDVSPSVAAMFEPGHWSADFEDGTAPGWSGEIVSTGLPEGSRHGLRTVRQLGPTGVDYHIVPPADWDRGLFALTENSTLHLTYRLGRQTWLNVFMHTNPADPVRGRVAMFKLQASLFPGVANRWQTASIPFSSFECKVPHPSTGLLEFIGGPPQPGEIVTAFAITAPHELDLVIDRIWVTPDGSGMETLVPVR